MMVERAIACDNVQDQAAVILHHIKDLPVDEQQTAAAETVKLVAREREFRNKSVHAQRQVQYRWVDNEELPEWAAKINAQTPNKPKFLGPTGWTFYAKPDLVDEDTDARGKIIRIIDDKIAGKVRCHHRRNLYFFGFVVSKQLSCEQDEALARGDRFQLPSIELVVRPLGSQEPEESFFFKRAREFGDLQDYRAEIAKMIAADEQGLFPFQTDWDCFKCPFRHDCPGYTGVDENTNQPDEVPQSQ